jgi:hypothetical protein
VGGRAGQLNRGLVGSALQLNGEQQIGQLALRVGRPRVVAALAVQVREVQRSGLVGVTRDRHDPGMCREQRRQ